MPLVFKNTRLVNSTENLNATKPYPYFLLKIEYVCTIRLSFCQSSRSCEVILIMHRQNFC